MAKKIRSIIKLQIEAGKATPAPPVGPALGQHGVNIMAFCKDYNDQTSSQAGSIVPVEITVFEDRSFKFITKTPPASDLLKRALNVDKGSSAANQQSIGSLPQEKIYEIARIKLSDLNTVDLEAAARIIKGTAHSMGIDVE